MTEEYLTTPPDENELVCDCGGRWWVPKGQIDNELNFVPPVLQVSKSFEVWGWGGTLECSDCGSSEAVYRAKGALQ